MYSSISGSVETKALSWCSKRFKNGAKRQDELDFEYYLKAYPSLFPFLTSFPPPLLHLL